MNAWDLFIEVRDRTLAGQSYRQIAAALGVAPGTVRSLQIELPRPLPVLTEREFSAVLFFGATPMPTRDAA